MSELYAILEGLESPEELDVFESLLSELDDEDFSTAVDPTDPAARWRETIRSNQTKQVRSSQDIGPPPNVPTHKRRRASDESLLTHLETYYGSAFVLSWSEDHLRLIVKLQRAIDKGELSALAMPRGSGKTTIIVRAAIWAIVTGRRRYVAIVAATESKAQKLLLGIKTEVTHNDLLKADYGNELHCLIALNNNAKMTGGQHVLGHLTGVGWSADSLNSGYIASRKTNNAIVVAKGITGDIRGEQQVAFNGEILRPDLVLVDDPQTKQSAGSKSQCQKRHETMMGDVLGMAGPGVSIAGLCACTVIYADDLAHRLLDREQSPEWQGETCRMVYKWPDSDHLWDEYRSLYEHEQRNELSHERSTQFILDRYEEMHHGHKVGWEDRYDKEKEVSALHHAYNLRIRDEGAFMAEYQNDPMSGYDDVPFDLNAEEIALRVVPNLDRNEIPDDCSFMTAAVDVQHNVLFYVVCAWTDQGKCYIVDYGTFPDQNRSYFNKREIRNSLQDVAQTDELEASIRTGLDITTGFLLEKEYKRTDGSSTAIDKLCIDARDGSVTAIVRKFCHASYHKARLHPSMGQYIGCNSKKWHKLKHDKRDKRGLNCKFSTNKNNSGRRELIIDVNFWKAFVAARLTINQSSGRAMVLFDDTPAHHRMFAEHCSDERCEKKVGKNGDIVIEFAQDSGAENDFWDCLVYNSALANASGIKTHDENKKVAGNNRTNTRTNPSTRAKVVRSGAKTTDGKLTPRQRLEQRVKRNQR